MEKPVESKGKFHIEILAILKDAQQQHGLRHKDYQSYQQYVSRKLHRMRKSLNFQQGKGNRVTPKKMTRAMLTDNRYLLIKLFEAERAWAQAMQLKGEAHTEPRKVYHMRSRLKKAVERASELWELCRWTRCTCGGAGASGGAGITGGASGGAGITGGASGGAGITGGASGASDGGEEAAAIGGTGTGAGGEECERCAVTDAHTYLESRSYYYTMQAVRYFEISEWKKAKPMFEKAWVEYSGLAQAVDKDQRQVYASKCEELQPLIRYCANNAGEAEAALDQTGPVSGDQFSDLLRQIYQRQVAVVTEVRWLDIVIPVRLDAVRLLILALSDANKELARVPALPDSNRISLLDSLLKSCTDSLSSVRDEFKNAASSTGAGVASATAGASTNTNPSLLLQSSATLESMSRLQILFVYLNYVKLTKTAERNLIIIESNCDSSTSKPQNMARLYDTVVQNLQELAALPGLNHDTQSGHGSGPQLELQAKIWAFRALRCYYLSQAHLLSRRYNECTALLTRTLRHCETALTALSDWQSSHTGQSDDPQRLSGVAVGNRLIPGPTPEEMADKINKLVDQIGADQLICRADRCLSMIDDSSLDCSAAASDNIDLPLIKRLEEFVEDPYLSKKTSSQSAGRLIEMSPEFEPIPVKPVFFDLAYYHVKFPSLDDKIKEGGRRGGKQTGDTGSGRGLTGMVKGWIWGK